VTPARTYNRFEATIAYDGCVIPEHGQPTAFFDDRSAIRTYQLHVGQQIANGVIAGITIDGLQYRVGTTTTLIPPAHFLNGESSASYDESADVAPVPDATPAPDGTPLSATDLMLQKLRARHNAENGITPPAGSGGAAGAPAAQDDPNAPPVDDAAPPADNGGGDNGGGGNGN
jgi:hypothetical protein